MTELRSVGLGDGGRMLLGRLGPEDRERVLRAFHLLSPADRRARFWSAALPLAQIERICSTDGWRAAAWALVDPERPEFPGLGGASWWRDRERPERAEFAVTIAPSERRRGVATLLERVCREEAAAKGIREFHGRVQPDNEAIKRWLRKIGARSHWDGGVVEWRWPIGWGSGREAEPPPGAEAGEWAERE